MDCSTLQQKLAEYADGSLNPYELKQIEKHIAACETCRSYVSDLTGTIEALKGLDEIPSPPWLTQKVMQKIRTEARPKKGLIRKLFFPLHIKLPLEAVATLLIAGAALLIMKSMGPDLQPVTTTTEKPQVQTLPSEKEPSPKEYPADARTAEKTEQLDAPTVRPEAEKSFSKPRMSAPQPIPAPPVPAPPASSAPVARYFETGKAPDFAKRQKDGQKAAADSAPASLSGENKGTEMPVITLEVRDREKAIQQIETTLPKFNGRVIATDKHTTGTTLTIQIDPSRIDELTRQLEQIGRIREPQPRLQSIPGNKMVIMLINQ